MISLKGVSKRYGDIEALRDVTLEIERGETFTVLGPNGSGKSTLLRILAGLEEPTEGDVLFDGKSIVSDENSDWRRRTTLVFQRPVILRGSVYNNVAYGLRQRGLSKESPNARTRRPCR
jgi:ABC-type Fe3+/spermidine/putrescine transport system ATPase subunit